MDVPEGVNVSTLQGRIESFSTAHHLSKRRVSSVKKRTPATVSWPHKSPLPAELARAGFFYRPTSDSHDNCMCFVCQRQLDGWEEGDDAVAEHLKHAPECGWAINASIAQAFSNGRQVNEDPMSAQLAQARTDTFGDSWPYEGKKGWKCKVAKMVAAGWCYDPSPEYDDGVTCMYCSLSLDGWERNDDPFVEHQRRALDCEFFKLLDEWADSREQAKGKKGKGKGRASRASKGSRLSTQSIATAVSEAPSQMSLDLDEPAGEDDSVLTTATNATVTSTAGKGRKKVKATTAKGKAKGVKGKKKASMAVEDTAMEDESPAANEEAPVFEEPPLPPKRQTKRKVSRNETSHIEDTLNASQIQKPIRAKRSKAKERLSEDESQLQAELQASIDATLLEKEETPKPKRGTKRTSNGAPKLDSSVIGLDDAPISFTQSQSEKPKRGRPKKQPAKTVETEEQEQEPEVKEIPQRVSSIPTDTGPKSKKKGKKASKTPAEPEPELNIPIEEPEADLEDEEMQDFDFARSLANPINPYRPMEGTPEPPADEPSPAPSTPTPVRVQPSSSAAKAFHSTPLRLSASHKEATPTPSPQSSDAENKPPSSRPASVRPPIFSPPVQVLASTRRVPLTETTPSYANRSPVKRTLGGITSSHPWSPTVLENIFLNSPVKANLQYAQSGTPAKGKENVALTLPNVEVDHLDSKALKDVVKKVKQGLSDEEKGMSVEEWVRWNARIAEDRLKSECEERVMRFEMEGARALRALEGIECIA